MAKAILAAMVIGMLIYISNKIIDLVEKLNEELK